MSEDKIKTVTEKLKIYQDELERVKQELTHKRTELATLARKTVEDFEVSIPNLVSKASTLQVEIDRLEKIIEQKTAKFNEENNAVIAQYRNLENALKREYELKNEKLVKRENDNALKVDEYKRNLANLEQREASLKADREAFEKKTTEDQKAFAKEKELFEKEKSDSLTKINSDLAESEHKLKNINVLKDSLELMKKDVAKQTEDLKKKSAHADEIIARINEATAILNKARELEIKNDDRAAKLNELSIKLSADTRRNNARTSSLDDIDAILKKREENIKVLEAAKSEV